MIDKYHFTLDLTVRDYECDIQGVVNNSVYQNYLEHTRHEFIKSMGLDFAALNKKGINPMVIRIELDYKMPLRSGDEFEVRSRIQREGNLKIVFYQDIYRKTDDQLCLKGKVIAATIVNGRPAAPAEMYDVIEEYLVKETM